MKPYAISVPGSVMARRARVAFTTGIGHCSPTALTRMFFMDYSSPCFFGRFFLTGMVFFILP